MFNPPHPGLTLKDDVLPALGLTVTQAAQQLDVSRVACIGRGATRILGPFQPLGPRHLVMGGLGTEQFVQSGQL